MADGELDAGGELEPDGELVPLGDWELEGDEVEVTIGPPWRIGSFNLN